MPELVDNARKKGILSLIVFIVLLVLLLYLTISMANKQKLQSRFSAKVTKDFNGDVNDISQFD